MATGGPQEVKVLKSPNKPKRATARAAVLVHIVLLMAIWTIDRRYAWHILRLGGHNETEEVSISSIRGSAPGWCVAWYAPLAQISISLGRSYETVHRV